ncbi:MULTISPECIES: hypothetical protein [Polymorphospora]|uniref:Acetyltransferase n=1 Tax=Polymorphospora lycopeni TaxID=3140240 RepID=A0ABV5CK24_9ACTN
MGRIGEVWQLRRGDEVLGEITVTDADFPWLGGCFAARPGFAEVAPLFAEEVALATVLEDDDSAAAVEAWETAYDRITTLMTLVAPSGPVAEFLLHMGAGECWFRWSDEPLTRE